MRTQYTVCLSSSRRGSVPYARVYGKAQCQMCFELSPQFLSWREERFRGPGQRVQCDWGRGKDMRRACVGRVQCDWEAPGPE